MGKSLVIVESPAKARTINKFLGKDFRVKASMGHVRDLPKNPKKKGDPDWIGVDEEKDFEPHYIVLRDKKKTVDAILEAAEKVDEILLAADPDREGEAICWHLKEILRKKLDKPIRRVEFNEITKAAIRKAIDAPREIDLKRVDAQQARRILDRIVGYRISPLLWDRVRRGLSAGRVQTVALRMVVEREREIEAFEATEYWTVVADLSERTADVPHPSTVSAKLVSWRGDAVPWKKSKSKDKDEKIAGLPDEKTATEAIEHAQAAGFTVSSVEAKLSRRSPPPPFTTSKLQQEASRRFSLPVSRTMRIAQSLYEGKDVGALGTVGLITYMRTDSTRVSDEAVAAVREHIGGAFGQKFVPEKPRAYKQKKQTQDAHEAIRPTSMDLPPEKLASVLNRDELKLYTLIWNRFVASQMARAEFDVTTIEIEAGEARFLVKGEVLRFAGWLQVYQEQRSEDDAPADDAIEGLLPDLKEGQGLDPMAVTPTQNFTQPPPRFSEAMLVRALEENGIGRPSTYAAILTVLSDRDYVDKIEGRFKPSNLGTLVTDLMVEHFGDIFEIAYTAGMEEDLDLIEQGEKNGVDTLREFAARFRKDLEKARKNMENIKRRQVKTDVKCDKCDGMMVKRWGRFGEFLACENYPECKNTRDLDENEQPLPDVKETCPKCKSEMALRRGKWGPFLACTSYPECKTTRKIRIEGGKVEVERDQLLDEKCPECGKKLARKSGRYGKYVACSSYPECKYVKQDLVGVDCPKCGKGIAARRSKRGRTFYGCTGYPECDFVTWKKPVNEPCPQCGAKYRLESRTKKFGLRLICDDKKCGFTESLPDEGSRQEAAAAGSK